MSDSRRSTASHRRNTVIRSIFAAGIIVAVAVACSVPTSGPDPEPEPEPEPVTSNLFMSLGLDDGNYGLFAVSTETGRASRVNTAGSHLASNKVSGLAPGPQAGTVIGVEAFAMYTIDADDGVAREFPDTGLSVAVFGLAYDPLENEMYASSNGFLTVRSADTGVETEIILSPPNSLLIYGLAFDPVDRKLYGLERSFQEHSDFDHLYEQLYVLDVDDPAPEWIAVGPTGELWTHQVGLAFDLDNRMLFAVGNVDDPGALFRIDPETAATSRVGPTGLAVAAGGLAWIAGVDE